MHSEPTYDDLSSFAAALAGHRPAATTGDRDRLMFLAGQAAAGNRHPARASVRQALLALGCFCAAGLLGVALGWQLHAPDRPAVARVAAPEFGAPVDGQARVVQRASAAQATPAEQPSWRNDQAVRQPVFLTLRRRALNYGVDALPRAGEGQLPAAQRQSPLLETRDRWLKRSWLSENAT